MPVAQPRGGKPLPPFKRWAFAEAHYRQYLSDLLSVHSALEAALASCSAAPAGGDTALLPGGRGGAHVRACGRGWLAR